MSSLTAVKGSVPHQEDICNQIRFRTVMLQTVHDGEDDGWESDFVAQVFGVRDGGYPCREK